MSPHQNPVGASSLPHTCHIHRASHSYRFYHSKNHLLQSITKLLIMQSPLVLSYLVLLGHKNLPQLAIPKRRQPMFLSKRERPSLTATQNNQQDCSSACPNTHNICYSASFLIASSVTILATTNFMKPTIFAYILSFFFRLLWQHQTIFRPI